MYLLLSFALSSFSIAANGLGIAEVMDLEARHFH